MAPSQQDDWVDVLIIGAGPAGLMASMYLSEMGIKHRIVDKLGTRALNGRADGFHVRTVEIWDSFGLGSLLRENTGHFGEWALWNEQQSGSGIARANRTPSIGEDKAQVRTATFHQGYIEAALIAGARKRSGPPVERGVTPTTLSIDERELKSRDSHPITVNLKHLRLAELEHWGGNAHSVDANGDYQTERGRIDAFGDDPEDVVPRVSGKEGSRETVHAKYLIAGDGGHSWVRHQLPGFKMEGASSDCAWAVIDIVPITDFPDIRKNCTILSEHGTVLVVPREQSLVRLYIQLTDGKQDPKDEPWVMDGQISTVCRFMDIARRILSPFTLDYRYCDWWTIYFVGQRVSNSFSHLDRVFLAGDAVHTHTPKGGQGMNVSQQDAYNLAWKLGGVLKGQLHPSVLSTYEQERRPIAQALVELDKDLSDVLDAGSSAPQAEVASVYDRLAQYGSGVNIHYKSDLIANEMHCDQTAAVRLKVGMRIPDATVYNQASSGPTKVHSLLRSDGMWRLLIFAGDVSSAAQLAIVNNLGRKARTITGYDRSGGHAFARAFTLHSTSVRDVDVTDFHSELFLQNTAGERDYHAIFGDFPNVQEPTYQIVGGRTIGSHEYYGVNESRGALVMLRPDHMVSWVGELSEDGLQGLERWLSTFRAA